MRLRGAWGGTADPTCAEAALSERQGWLLLRGSGALDHPNIGVVYEIRETHSGARDSEGGRLYNAMTASNTADASIFIPSRPQFRMIGTVQAAADPAAVGDSGYNHVGLLYLRILRYAISV